MRKGDKVLINGYFGEGNAGDEAILEAEIALLRQFNAEITVAATNPEFVKRNHCVQTIPEYHKSPIRWKQVAASVDHVIIGGGGLIESNNITQKWLKVVLACQEIGVPVHFLGVGVTPPITQIHRYLYQETLKRATSIVVRDYASRRYLDDLGLTQQVTVKPDFAFHHSSKEKVFNMNPSSNNLLIVLRDVPWLSIDLQGLAKVVQRVYDSRGCNIQIAEFAGKESDRKLISELKKQLVDIPTTSIGTSGFRSLERTVSEAGYVIGMRLHSIVFAAKHGIPFLSVAYNPKCQSVPEYFGYGNVNWCVDIQPELVSKNIIDTWENEELRARLADGAQIAHRDTEKIFEGLNFSQETIKYGNEWLLRQIQRVLTANQKVYHKLGRNRSPAPKSVVPTNPQQLASNTE